MRKFDVVIWGTIPDCLEIEAADKNEAIEKAIQEVLEKLSFDARPTKKGAPWTGKGS
jgi:hypothetical protein